jgi:hypothetical protein
LSASFFVAHAPPASTPRKKMRGEMSCNGSVRFAIKRSIAAKRVCTGLALNMAFFSLCFTFLNHSSIHSPNVLDIQHTFRELMHE